MKLIELFLLIFFLAAKGKFESVLVFPFILPQAAYMCISAVDNDEKA